MTSGLAARLVAAAVVCAAAALLLGWLVAPRPPMRLDVAAGSALRGTGVGLALFFTALGRWPVVTAIGVVALGIAMTLRTGAPAVAVLLATQVLSQATNAVLKLVFHRARPQSWLVVHERDLSYPSGHAVTAVVLFVGLAVLAWHAPLPRPAAGAVTAALLLCAAGIPWSRLALGAHYPTDVAGGMLLGTAFLCAAMVLVARTPASLT
jgi:undecaprenyl-diphosphatase